MRGVLPPRLVDGGGWRFYSRLSRRTHLRANCRRYSDRALIQCSRRGLSRQIYIGSYCHGRFTWVHRTCSANEVSKKVPFPCWVSVASIGHNRANAISENEPSSETECESDCEVRHHITLTPDREIGFRRWRAGTSCVPGDGG